MTLGNKKELFGGIEQKRKRERERGTKEKTHGHKQQQSEDCLGWERWRRV